MHMYIYIKMPIKNLKIILMQSYLIPNFFFMVDNINKEI